MKKLIFFAATLFLLNTSDAVGQCNSENLSSQCIPKLAAGFNFLKSYKIDGDGGNKEKVEYSYVFLKGTQYMINICAPAQPTDGIIVSLFDSNRNKVASSKIDNQFISAIAYPCNATGVYYIQYTFEKPSSYCGGSALGFKR
ncbi:MAG TPA: hypothetical protein PK325_06915 [Cyclobacteriaceae bacterium]|nr:hypothetical protein [Cyclobacteriaceae bacterium]HMV09036.1 hypothetical protein [Cyclobacteriaceae bacterium]HMV89880.1 hypothetical protein [Cyclobacteriaceae bacterium]HMW99559.1 hypothetical protein [Cyclobacteriaceae bacterium]HMX51658.1 hypothetical protein [Cyclobacteriaceae bacterium]